VLTDLDIAVIAVTASHALAVTLSNRRRPVAVLAGPAVRMAVLR
jgi:hypothetical protein